MASLIKLSDVVMLAMVLLAVVDISDEAFIPMEVISRPVREVNAESEPICSSNTPCGWVVYVPPRRERTAQMKNTCTCPDMQQCVLIRDNMAVNAFEFGCREVPHKTSPAPNESSTEPTIGSNNTAPYAV